MKLSIIVPIYNEEDTLRKIFNKIQEAKLPIEKEIILVDDFSTDKTRKILEFIKFQNVRRVYHSENKGKGESIRTGIRKSTGDIILIQDADLEYSPKDYTRLIYPILNKKTKVVYGS
ncbi:MAG: glycosyltransferase family 2 protein [Nanoarchaeota archaeon]